MWNHLRNFWYCLRHCWKITHQVRFKATPPAFKDINKTLTLLSSRNSLRQSSRALTFIPPCRARHPSPMSSRYGSEWSRQRIRSSIFTNWLNTMALLPGLDCRIITNSRVKASIFEDVANSARLMRRKIEPVATVMEGRGGALMAEYI